MKFKIGTIVTLKSNGLLHLANHSFLCIGGNENFTTPLMIVVEILKNNPEIDEETGELKSSVKAQNKFKCMYFSNKTMKYEENWFGENELSEYKSVNLETNIQIDISFNTEIVNDEKLEKDDGIIVPHKLKLGDIVRFKTVDEEAKKSKSFNENDNKKGLKPLVTFIAPSMQVVGFANPEKKDQSLDLNTGKPKRVFPKKMVKCKFFNTEADKFSEYLIPIECLKYIDNSKLEDQLEQISRIIKDKELILIETKQDKYFGKPNSVHVFSGRFQLSFYNELIKKNEFVWMDEIVNFDVINFSNSQYYPGINEGSNNVTGILEFIELIKDTIVGEHFKITYRNLKDQRVSRYITIKRIGNQLNDEYSSNLTYYYLKSYCHLREASRDFRSDRILSIRTIYDEKLNLLLYEKSK